MIISAMEKAKSHNALSFKSLALLLFSLVHIFGINGTVNDDDKKVDPSSVLKTIVNGDEIIDCVDIYKQPAFNHPLLKNHTLQLKPSSYPTGSKSEVPVNSTEHTQMWHRNGEYCPKGTVAILRSSTADIPPKNPSDLRAFNNTNAITPAGFHFEYAAAFLPGRNYYGANADINVWNPRVQPKEASMAQVWVTDGGGANIESVEAGWMVSKSSPHPTVFIYWTRDGYKTSGCFNTQCPGFVQTSSKIVVVARIDPVSTYGGKQFHINVRIHRDYKTSNWWFSFQGRDIGYWPGELFRNLKPSAKLIEWGGQVMNSNPYPTTTQMGSGHFPNEGYGKAAWFKNLEYADGSGFFNSAGVVAGHATRPESYDIQVQPWVKGLGVYFLYGGPGKK